MNEAINLLIMRHTSLMDSATKLSQIIFKAATRNDIELVNYEMDNRERVISVIDKFQNQIEGLISDLKPDQITPQVTEIVKAWANDVGIWVQRIEHFNVETVELLEDQKEDTTKEIASIFKSKQMFKGYNLNNLKK